VLLISDVENLPMETGENQNQRMQMVRNLLIQSPPTLVKNVETKMAAMMIGDDVWPITINKTEYQNALVCSPYTTYVTYPLDEIKKFNKYWIKWLVLFNAVVMSVLCRLSKINQVVQINNNLNSLIKHPSQFSGLLPTLTQKMIEHYPNHAITFFRVNDILDEKLLSVLRSNHYCVFPDRAVHVFFPNNHFMKRSHTKRDISLLRKTEHEIIAHEQLTPDDGKCFAKLYRQLFVEKHSKYNPIYTEHYFRQAIENHWHHYTALRNKAGKIEAFISWFVSENNMVCGPLGYDVDVDQKKGLYRQLVAICLQYANENNMPFNMGGGSDEFKSNRGSTKILEYAAVYYHHLPFYRSLAWRLLRWVCNRLIKKIMDDANRIR